MATEKRLIDANVAIERARNSDKIVRSSIWETGEVVEFLEDCPIVDAVEVVRCKGCFGNGCCSVQDALEMGDEGYCPKGRKENR